MRAFELIALQMILLISLVYVEADKMMRPKFSECKTWSDNVYVKHSMVFDASDPHVNFTAEVLKEIPNVDVHVEGVFTQKLDPNYFLTFNTTWNVCRLMAWRQQSPVGTLIHSYLKEYGNLVETCPIAKGHYYMHKFWIPEDPALATLPEANFEMTIQFFEVGADNKRTMIINDHVVGEAVVQDVNNVKPGILAMLPRAG